jgi:hypothetical protein
LSHSDSLLCLLPGRNIFTLQMFVVCFLRLVTDFWDTGFSHCPWWLPAWLVSSHWDRVPWAAGTFKLLGWGSHIIWGPLATEKGSLLAVVCLSTCLSDHQVWALDWFCLYRCLDQTLSEVPWSHSQKHFFLFSWY